MALKSEVHVDKFAGVRAGTLVKRSEHWHRVHPGDPRGQVGIVVDRNVYQEDGALVTYPVIWWEGQASASGTHPDNADVVTDSPYLKNTLKRKRS